MKKLKTGSIIRRLAFGLAVLSCASLAQAHPYASGITNKAGTISFILNEPATDVSVVFDGGGAGNTNDLGSLTNGVHSFSLGTHSRYAINVLNYGNGHLTEISSDTNTLNSVANVSAVAVNKNPADHNFGRIYMGKRLGGGFLVRNADQSDAIGLGSTPATAQLGAYLNTGGSSFDSARMYVGPQDDLVYVGAGTTLANGMWLAALDPDLSTNTFVLAGTAAYGSGSPPAGQYHGGVIGTPFVTGSLAQGNLTVYAMDWSYPPGQCLLQWQIGSGPFPSSAVPNILANSTETQIQNWADAFLHPNGTNYYTYLDRSSHTSPGFGGALSVFNVANGSTAVWQSFNNSITSGYDYFANCADVTISPDGTFVVGIDNGTGYLIFCNLDANGIPIESTLTTNVVGTANSSSTYGSVCFDAAWNIYEVFAGNALLKVFSQGLTTLAVTSNDATTTNGTFSLTFPLPSISSTASIPTASQNYANNGGGPVIPGQLTISRTGNIAVPLTIYFTLGGTATNGSYTATMGANSFTPGVTNSLTFAAGQSSATITITPDTANVPRLTTSVAFNLVANPNYSAALQGAPVVNIVNTGPQAIQISGVGGLIAGTPCPSMYKGLTNDFAAFVVTRLGDTNFSSSYTVTNFTFAGTAVAGVDYTAPARTIATGAAGTFPITLGGGVTINPGDVNVTATISPLPSASTGNKTVIIGVASDSTVPYTTVNTNTVTLSIIDNAEPSNTVLFADPLTNSVDSNNNDGVAQWNITFANTNSPVVPDYNVNFGYTLANDFVGNPPNGATTALKVTVNKNGTLASGGVNLYPTNISFTGNFDVSFDMMLIEGDNLPSATEYVIFGINHSGLATNWFAGDDVGGAGYTYPWGVDGVWYAMNAEASSTSIGDYLEITGEGLHSQYGYVPLAVGAKGSGTPGAQNIGAKAAATFASSFKNSYDYPPGPYTAYPYYAYYVSGIPANRVVVSEATAWVNVDIQQINNVITMSMNKTPIFSYTNTTLYTNGGGTTVISTNGTIMFGYVDPFADQGSPDAAAYFSNLKVTKLSSAPSIISIAKLALSGGNVVINFTSSNSGDTTSSFTVLGSSTATAIDTPVSGVTITQTGSGAFQASFPSAASAGFYRIKHN